MSRKRSTLHGVVVVDKPKGPTSHDVVARVRRALHTREVGHAGTLDPMATGVLVVAVGEATKLVPWLTAADKRYATTVRFGVDTDSLDAQGEILRRDEISSTLRDALDALANGAVPKMIEDALAAERARDQQVPPVISAIRIGGERAHELTRKGTPPDLPPRPVVVKDLVVSGGASLPEPHLQLEVEVSKGYFVRSLARDLAARLGTVGHLSDLRRTRSGAFELAHAVALDENLLREGMVPLARAATIALPSSTLSEKGVLAARQGQRVAVTELSTPHPCPSAWLDESGMLVAVGEVVEGAGRVLRGFCV